VAYKVVCISSQDGTGAEEAAHLVATALGFRLVDEAIVARAAVEAGVDEDLVANIERRRSLAARLVEGFDAGSMATGYIALQGEGYLPPGRSELMRFIQSVIEDTAVAGNVVIVAHAASLAIAARGDALRVLLTASEKTRQRRLAASLQIDEKAAARKVKRSDAGRADYLKRFYDIGAELPTHYDLVINTDRLGADDAARVIIGAVLRSA
jgi:cytidylate kinase-like protein